MELLQVCRRCMLEQHEEDRALDEIARSRDKSIQDLLTQARSDQSSTIGEKAKEHTKKRQEEREKQLAEYQEKLKQREEELSFQAMDEIMQGESSDRVAKRLDEDKLRQELEQTVSSLRRQPDDVSGEDIERGLEEYIEQGYLEMDKGQVKITSKGARRLASRVLKRILGNLARREMGSHTVEKSGFGVTLSVSSSRKYELGDEYALVDIHQTLLNSLERDPPSQGRVSLELGDFQVFETVHETKMCAGLIIDESGSMIGQKINAAVDTSLALSEMIRREPKDILKVFLFSGEVRAIPYWDILNASFTGGTTDIRAAMRAFRMAVRNETGDKQAYLITDTEPNTEDGMCVGFERASLGVIEEALHYKQEGITLNIVMLDENPRLKQLASILALKNAGRVFFTTPQKTGEVIIEDYLVAKKRGV